MNGVASPPGGSQPVVSGLTTSHVSVTYSGFGVHAGTVTVKITGFSFNISIPLVGASLNLGEYKTTLTGEAAGYIPPAI